MCVGMFSWCCSIPGAEVPLPSRPLHHCCLLTSPSAFRLISGITFQLDMSCNLQEQIFSPIPRLISLMIFITPGPAECLHSSFKYNNSNFPNSPHMPIYILTIKLQSGGESVNVYTERSGQTFSYTNLHHRRKSSSHSPYELNKTLLTCRKTIIFFLLSACRSRSLLPSQMLLVAQHFKFPRCLSQKHKTKKQPYFSCWLHQVLSFHIYIQI